MTSRSTPDRIGRDGRSRPGFTLVELLVVITIIGILISLLMPAVQAAREAARRTQCANQMKNLALACLSYESANQTLPPGTLRVNLSNGGGGINDTSPTWMARCLPYLEQQAIYDMINWETLPSHTSNTAVYGLDLPFTWCPSDTKTRPDPAWGPTNYVVCIGNADETLPGRPHNGAFYVNGFTKLARVRDGASNTLMVSECTRNQPWIKRYNGDTSGYNSCLAGTEPDITQNVAASAGRGQSWFYGRWSQCWVFSTRLPPSDRLTWNHECELWTHHGVYAARSRHPGGVQASMIDGSVHFFSESTDLITWRALGSIAGREPTSVID